MDPETEEYFVPDQGFVELDVSLERALSLVNASVASGVLLPSQAASAMARITNMYARQDLAGLQEMTKKLAGEVSDIKAHTSSQFMDLIQYITFNGMEMTPYTMGYFRAIGKVEAEEGAKDLATRVKGENRFNSLVVNPKNFRMSVKYDEVKPRVKQVSSSYWVSEAILFPAGEELEIQLNVTHEGQSKTLTYGPQPVPVVGSEHKEYRTYYPRYKAQGADTRVFNVAMVNAARKYPDKAGVLLLEGRNEMARMVNTHYYGNGSPEGQIARFNAVSERGRAIASQWKMGSRETYYQARISRIFKFTERASDLQMFKGGFSTNLADLINRSVGEGTALVAVNLTADAGPWYKKAIRKDTYPFDIEIGQQILNACAGLGSEDSLKAFWEEWDWLRVVNMKPKSEVYERGQFLTKTRNIFVYDGFVPLLASVVLRRPFRKLVDYTTTGSTCLLGFSFAHGGFTKLLEDVEQHRAKDLVRVLSFSDNMYMFDPKRGWASFDGEKMEGSIVIEVVHTLMKFVMEEYWKSLVTDMGREGLKNKASYQTWHAFATGVFPTLACNAVALFGANQLGVVGQASGNQATGLANQLAMGSLAVDLEDALNLGKLEKMLDQEGTLKSMKPLAKKLEIIRRRLLGDGEKIEKTHELDKASLKRGVGLTLEKSVSLREYYAEEVVVPLDLLGADMVRTTMFGVKIAVPVLNRDRLVKAMAFDKQGKGEAGMEVPDSQVLQRQADTGAAERMLFKTATLLMKSRQLYVIGGWAYPPLAEVLKATILSTSGALFEHSQDPLNTIVKLNMMKPQFEEDVWGDGEEDDVAFKIQGVPTTYEVFKLFANENQLAQANKWIEENWDEQDDQWLLTAVPWSLLQSFDGAVERLESIAGPERMRQLVIKFLDPSEGKVASVTEPRQVKKVGPEVKQPVKLKGDKVPVRPEDPVRSAFQPKNKPGDWVSAVPSPQAAELLGDLASAGPVFFRTGNVGGKNPVGQMRAAFADALLTILNSAGKVAEYPQVRKAVDVFLTKAEESSKIKLGADAPVQGIKLPKKKGVGFIGRVKAARQSDPRAVIILN